MAVDGTEDQQIVITESVLTPVTPQPSWDRVPFDQAIESKGYEADIYRALRCPCAEQATGNALSDCQNCGGTGWFFIDKQHSQILCSSMSNRNKYENWTIENTGTVNITTRPQDKLGYMDMVVLTELEMWTSERVMLYLNTADNNYFSFLIYEPVSVFDVYLFVDKTKPLIYIDPSDYTVSNNKIVISQAILDGIAVLQYPMISLRYTFNPTYYVMDINRDLIKQKTKPSCADDAATLNKTNYPLNCVARLAQWVLKAPNYDGVGLIDNTNYNRTPPNYDR